MQRLANLTDAQYALILRTALSTKPKSKRPGHVTALCLNQVAEAVGIDLTWKQRLQDEKAENRWEKKETRIHQLEKLKKKLENKAIKNQPVES